MGAKRHLKLIWFAALLPACGGYYADFEERRALRDEGPASSDLDVDPLQFALSEFKYDLQESQSSWQLLAWHEPETLNHILYHSSRLQPSLSSRLSAEIGTVQKKLLSQRGAMHQALMPDIRQQINANPQLKLLLSLPPGIQDIIKGIMVNDEKIHQQISQGLQERIDQGLRNLTGSIEDYFFDGFVAWQGDDDHSQAQAFEGFAIGAQSQVWRLHIAQMSRALQIGEVTRQQILALLKTLAEWKYLFGLDQRGEDDRYGGLSIDASTGRGHILYPFDPRQDPDFVGFFSGEYQVFYPVHGAVDLATQVREVWQRQQGPVELKEMAQQWTVAAEAFSLLRPRMRSQWQQMAHSQKDLDDLLPDNSFELSLLFLASISELLDGPFIDADQRLIRSSAVFDQGQSSKPASIAERLLLLQALRLWTRELSDVEDLKSSDHYQRLSTATSSLLKPMQLIVQSLLQEMSEISLDDLNEESLHIWLGALTELAELEASVMNSPHLNQRLLRFVCETLLPALSERFKVDAPVKSEHLWSLSLYLSVRSQDARLRDDERSMASQYHRYLQDLMVERGRP